MASQIHRPTPKIYQNGKETKIKPKTCCFQYKLKILRTSNYKRHQQSQNPAMTVPIHQTTNLASMLHRRYSEAKQIINNRIPKCFSSPSSISGGMEDDDPSLTAAVPALPPWGSITGSPPPPDPPTALPFSAAAAAGERVKAKAKEEERESEARDERDRGRQ